MAGDTITQYLDDDGNPVGADSGVTPPKGYSLLTSKKSPVAPKKKVSELKAQAAKMKPVVPPAGYVMSAYTPSFLEQARGAVANSAIGYSLEQALPKLADALHLHPTEKTGTEKAKAHKDQLISPEYVAPALTEAIRTGPLMGTPAPPEGRPADALSNQIEGALTAAGGLTSGKSMATMAGTAVAAGLTAGVVNPASAQLLSRLVSGGFTADMLHGLYQQHKEYRKAVDAGDIDEAQKIQGEMGVTGIMALLTGKHALSAHPFTPIEPKDTPVRERTNVLHRNTAGSVRQAEGQTPTVWLNPDAWHSVMGQIYPEESSVTTNGFNIPKKVLESHANDPQFVADHPEIADLLTKAHEGSGEGGAAIAKKRDSIQDNVRVMREELNHSWQRNLSANGNYENHLKPGIFSHLRRQIPQGMYDHLVDNGYDGHDSPQMVAEAAAKFLGGDIEKYNVSPEEAHDFLKSYLDEVVAEHGTKALEELKRIRGAGKTAKEATLAEHKGTANGIPNDGLANGSTDRGSFQRLSAGRGSSPESPEGTQPSGEGNPLFNRDKPTWYLKSERLIGDKMKGPAPAEDIHKMLLSGGVKPEEMQWTGLDDFLKSKGKDKVTPEDIREHLANNNIQIKEVTKGGENPVEWKSYPDGVLYTPDGYKIERMPTNGMYRLSDSSGQTQAFNSLDEAKAAVDRYRSYSHQDTVPVKYGSYVLPGGENYREMLLIKQRPTPDVAKLDALQKNRRDAAESWVNARAQHDLAGTEDSRTQAEKAYHQLGRADDAVKNYTAPFQSPTQVFQSGHWEEPNIVAHTRFNDRTGPNGEKLLHVEEVQSDWHQKGRDKGYTDPKVDEANTKRRGELIRERQKLVEEKGLYRRAGVDTNEYTDKIDKLDEELDSIPKPGAVPDAPFKKTWHEMALRRLLKHAVDKGYEGLSWTGGEDQAARYDLSKQISQIQATKTIQGKYAIAAFDMDKARVIDDVYDADKLPDVVGKELAQKIVDEVGSEPKPGSAHNKTYSGLDLKVGGEGMKGFYDKIVPDYLNKFGKKFGAKVSPIDFDVSDPHAANKRGITDSIKEDPRYGKMDLFATVDSNGRWTGISGDPEAMIMPGEELIHVASKDGTLSNAVKELEKGGRTTKTVQHLPITPEMRKSVAEEGVPLFNREQVKTPEFKKWFGDSKAVDEKGEPKVVYHGTAKDFHSFDPAQTGNRMAFDTGDFGNAVYFADKPETAEGYAKSSAATRPFAYTGPSISEDKLREIGWSRDLNASTNAAANSVVGAMSAGKTFEEAMAISGSPALAEVLGGKLEPSGPELNPRIMPVYLKAEKPLVLENNFTDLYDLALTPEERKDLSPKNKGERWMETDPAEMNKLIREAGYDSVHDLDYGQWAVFDPTHVKSAIGNNGAFDPKDPNILRNREKDEEDKEDDNLSAEQDDPTSLDVNTNVEGDGGESPEQVETGSTGTAPTTVIPVQGNTQLASAPVQEPVVPIATKPVAKVLPLSQIKVLAAGLAPQHQVKNVRELMAEAAKRMNTAIVP